MSTFYAILNRGGVSNEQIWQVLKTLNEIGFLIKVGALEKPVNLSCHVPAQEGCVGRPLEPIDDDQSRIESKQDYTVEEAI